MPAANRRGGARPARPIALALSVALACLTALTGCTPAAPSARRTPLTCPPEAGTAMLVYSLFFGQAVPDRHDVTEAEWIGFVEDVLAPALPAGFTVLNARGAWRNPQTGRTIHEASRMLLVALPDTPASHAAITRVRTDYQDRFRQQFVGMTMYNACGAF